jgi:signal transduction histidine kinase
MKTLAFAEAAHEFRNPLTGIIAALDLLSPIIKKDHAKIYFNNAKNCA